MRFITEFELWSRFEIKNYKGLREKGSAEWLGMDIAKAFGWDKKNGLVPNNPVAERHSLEIEAFPMEKWIEFKANILNISDLDSIQYKTLIDLISELESFGKPAADTITNQKLTNDRTE